jgi:hypothetical protein
MLVDQKRLFALLTFLLFPGLSVLAQQSPSWQGSRGQQVLPPAPPQEPPPAAIPQPAFPPPLQNDGEAHPQVMEMPTVQEPATLAPQSPPSTQQPDVQPPAAARALNAPPKPAFLGLAGQTVLACRYPAGVRVTRVIEGSPAHKAGLKGEATLTWKQAMTGVLTMTPIAPLILPFVSNSDHGGPGDLILAVDGKRVHNREELEQEMGRFRPGDMIYFSILREQSGLRQVPVQLVEYPDTPPDAATAMVK